MQQCMWPGAFAQRFLFTRRSLLFVLLLQALARKTAEELGLGSYIRSGTYFHDSGPTYESPMEIHAMRVLGGDSGA